MKPGRPDPSQCEFSFGRRRKGRPCLDEDARALELWLAAREGWHTARKIAADTGWDERRIRLAASHAMPRVMSFPGSAGYKLTAQCTPDEIERAAAVFRAQAREMTERAVNYTRALHDRDYRRGDDAASLR